MSTIHRYGNIPRFPRAAGEPPRAIALRGLTEAFLPAGVSVYFLRWFVRGAVSSYTLLINWLIGDCLRKKKMICFSISLTNATTIFIQKTLFTRSESKHSTISGE